MCLAALALATLFHLQVLSAGTLTFDPGIRFHLSAETARGAVPVRDFEHGWNAGGWYVGAALYRLVAGNPGLWHWLFTAVTGTFLAGACLLVVLRRVRAHAGWLYAFTVAFLLAGGVPHGKYAIPAIWALALLPVGRGQRFGFGLAMRLALGAVTVLLHVDLAVMLAAGGALFDLVARRDLGVGRRILLAGAPAVGAAAAFGGEVLVYASVVGYPAERLVDFLVFGPAATEEGVNFGYPLLAPRSVLQLVYPVVLLAPFVPAVWRRLSDPTRLVAVLHVAMGLTAIRKADLPHVANASVLLVALVALVAADVARGRDLSLRLPHTPASFGLAVTGAVWLAAGLLVAFRFDSLFAWPALLAFVAATVVFADRSGRHAAGEGLVTVGALVAAGGLLAAATVGHVVTAATGDHDPQAELVAEELRPLIGDCLDEDRRAWVVRHPLGLYEELDVENPTPFYLFWRGFRSEHDRVRAMMDAGEIPTIIQVNRFPPGWGDLARDVLDGYERCAEVWERRTNTRVTVWVHRGARRGVQPRGGRLNCARRRGVGPPALLWRETVSE